MCVRVLVCARGRYTTQLARQAIYNHPVALFGYEFLIIVIIITVIVCVCINSS